MRSDPQALRRDMPMQELFSCALFVERYMEYLMRSRLVILPEVYPDILSPA